MKKSKNPVIYLTRDEERASSLETSENYSIISKDGLDTLELLQDPEILKKIKDRKVSVVVFKNNTLIEELAKKEKIELLNPSAKLAEQIENKITQVEWLAELASLLPPHLVALVKNIEWTGKPFVIQWAHSHSGEGTILIQNEKTLSELKEKFPEREARVVEYIKGPTFTVNAVVTPDFILLGNVSYQITGILPFTENPFTTIGNDWSVPQTILSATHLEKLQKIANLVGTKLQKAGWKGLFGLDFLYDEERDRLYLLEINARQPASTTYESELQKQMRIEGVKGLTTFEAHLLALRNEPITNSLIQINDGAQILQRVTSATKKVDPTALKNRGYKVILYQNTKPNSDLARIQSSQGIMETHNKFNKRGKEIVELL